MSKRTLTAEEMRLKGLEMIRQAKEKERHEKEAIRLKLGMLLERHIETGFAAFNLDSFMSQIGEVIGRPLEIVRSSGEKMTGKPVEE
jgi:hypothetical protein